MATRLSSLLVRERVVDVGTMEQAFRRKDQLGGRLGTNLLELAAIDDTTLNAYLSEAVELPEPPAELLAGIDDEVLSILGVGDVLHYGVIPAADDGKTLSLLVRDRIDAETERVLSEVLGRGIEQYVVADFRFEHALAELYGVRPSRRAERLIERYPVKIGARGMTGSHPHVDEASTGSPAPILSALGNGWTSEQLGRFLAHCSDRDDIVDALLGFTGNYFPRSAVMVVQHGGLHGFSAHGLGVTSEQVRAVALQKARILSDAKRQHNTDVFVGLPQDLGLTPFYDALGVDWPPEMAAFVLRVGSRPALLLAADNASRPVPRNALPPMEAAAKQGAGALVRMVRARKQRQGVEDDLAVTAPHIAVPSPDLPLAQFDDGWDVFGEPDGATPLVGAPTAELVETNPDSPHAIKAKSGEVEAAPDGGPSPSLAGADDLRARDDEQLDDLMFGEIERLVLEEHGDDEANHDRKKTIQGFAGITPEQIAQARAARRTAREGHGVASEPEALGEAPDETGGREASSDEHLALGGYGELIDALLSDDQAVALKARAELLLTGDEVLSALSERFPGPVDPQARDPERVVAVGDCGPLLRVVIELGPRFAPVLGQLMTSADRDQRFFAVLCCREIRHPANLAALTERLFDSDPAIRRLAVRVTELYRDEDGFTQVLTGVRRALERGDPERRLAAAEAAAKLGDVESVPSLIDLVNVPQRGLAETAQQALEQLVFQGYGTDKKKWLKWYGKHGQRRRIEWLVDAVTHKRVRIRELVSQALQSMPQLGVELDPHAGRRELKRLQARLNDLLRETEVRVP